MNAEVSQLAVIPLGDNAGLYAGGAFRFADGVEVNRVAAWDGSGWRAMGTGVSGGGAPTVFAVEVWHHFVVVGGVFTMAGGASASRIAQWDGLTWSSLGTGVSSTVFSLEAAETASDAPMGLYVGGGFRTAGGVTAHGIARWDGAQWHDLGSGLVDADGFDGVPNVILMDQQGLFVAGSFATAGGVSCRNIASWDGTRWQRMGDGVYGLENTTYSTYALVKFRGELIVGGNFTMAGGASCFNIARWQGDTWGPLGTWDTGLEASRYPQVSALAAWQHPGSADEALYASRRLVALDGTPLARLMKWNGLTWLEVSDLNESILSFAIFGDHLHAGGFFTRADGILTNRIGRWGCVSCTPPPPLLGDMNNDGIVNGLDIARFVSALTGPPIDVSCRADMNEDGVLDSTDVGLFVLTLSDLRS